MRAFYALLLTLMCLGSSTAICAQQEQSLAPITRDNVDQITQVAMLGRGGLYDMVWSPDGDTLVVMGPNGIWLYDARDWAAQPVLLGDDMSGVWTGVFDLSGQFLMVPHNHGWRMWDIATHQMRFFRSLPEPFTFTSAMTISPDGHYLVTGHEQYNPNTGETQAAVALWEIPGGTLVSITEIEIEGPDSLHISPDGQTLLVTRDYQPPVLYRFADLLTQGDVEPIFLQDHPGEIKHITYTPNGNLYAVYGLDGELTAGRTHELRNLSDETHVISIAKPDWYDITVMDTSASLLAVSGQMGDIELYDIATGALYATLTGQDSTIAMAFDPSGQKLVAYVDGQILKVWDVQTLRSQVITDQHTQFGYVVRIHPNSREVAFGTQIREGEIQMWDMDTVQMVSTIPGAGGWTSSLAFNPQGTRLAFGGGLGCCPQIWNLETNARDTTFTGYADGDYANTGIKFVFFSADGMRLFAGGRDNTVRLWDVVTHEQLQAFSYDHDVEVTDGGLVKQGQQVLTLTEQTFKLSAWEVATGQTLAPLVDKEASNLVFSHDQTQFALSQYGSISIYDSETLDQLHVIPMQDNNTVAAFSPDKTLLAMITGRGNLSIYDVGTGAVLVERHVADWALFDLDWSTDGRRIAVTGREGIVFLFGVRTE